MLFYSGYLALSLINNNGCFEKLQERVFFVPPRSRYVLMYRVGHLLADLGWVDLDLESSQAGGPLL